MSTLNNPFRPDLFSPTQGTLGQYQTISGDYNSNIFNQNSGYNFFNPNGGGNMFGGSATDLIGDTKLSFAPGVPDAAAGGGGMFGGMKNMSAAQQMQMASGVGGIIQGLVGRKKRRAAQRAAKKEYTKQRSLYQALDTSNLAAGFGNAFENMENTYEDMTLSLIHI